MLNWLTRVAQVDPARIVAVSSCGADGWYADVAGRYVIDFARMPGAVASLAKELLEIEATGNRARAEAWFTRYGTMPAQLKAALDKTTSVPVDIDPITSFGEAVK